MRSNPAPAEVVAGRPHRARARCARASPPSAASTTALPPAADEVGIRYRVRHGTPKLGTNAYFFEEGHAGDYAKARYGEFRVAPDGEAILTGLRDEKLRASGAPPKRMTRRQPRVAATEGESTWQP